MSLALHAANSRSTTSGGDDEEDQAAESKVPDLEVTTPPAPDAGVRQTGRVERHGREEEEEEEQPDRLFSYLRDNMETIRELCKGLTQQIPPPDHCTVEG